MNAENRRRMVRKYSKTPKGRAAHRRATLKIRFGITPEQYDQMFLFQKGLCGICGEPSLRRLAVDHDHSTGKIRGLLCTGCNLGIGNFKEDINRMALGIVYLARTSK